ncbi:hypothetical protein ACFVTT_34090 [Streptomyces niveus]|uniref:hypothetical protein n=1 Tax=Streptomyces niveus TaxID=193462 RepID=UPI00343DDD7B
MATHTILRNTPLSQQFNSPAATDPRQVLTFDSYGSLWGSDTASETEASITAARDAGQHIDQWTVTDRAGCPMRIIRIVDPSFLDDILVIPGTTVRTAVAA